LFTIYPEYIKIFSPPFPPQEEITVMDMLRWDTGSLPVYGL
jgi:hypothetical protein